MTTTDASLENNAVSATTAAAVSIGIILALIAAVAFVCLAVIIRVQRKRKLFLRRVQVRNSKEKS